MENQKRKNKYKPENRAESKNKAQQEWIVGWHSVFAVLQKRPNAVSEILLEKGRSDGRAKQLEELAKEHNIVLRRINDVEAIVEQEHHQGVAIAVSPQAQVTESELIADLSEQSEAPCLLLILEEVQDPHNLGACWRSAEAFGVKALVSTSDRSAKDSPAVKKVAAGAAETLPLVNVKNLARFIEALKEAGVWIVGAAGEGSQDLSNFKFPKRCALIIGQEESGLKRLTREQCDYLVSIPMKGSVSSLNLSVAAGIFLSHASLSN
jgi:23S rRNA (guanosine2251-2'-O)-methyltransferase